MVGNILIYEASSALFFFLCLLRCDPLDVCTIFCSPLIPACLSACLEEDDEAISICERSDFPLGLCTICDAIHFPHCTLFSPHVKAFLPSVKAFLPSLYVVDFTLYQPYTNPSSSPSIAQSSLINCTARMSNTCRRMEGVQRRKEEENEHSSLLALRARSSMLEIRISWCLGYHTQNETPFSST